MFIRHLELEVPGKAAGDRAASVRTTPAQVKPPYLSELAALDDTYSGACSADVRALRKLLFTLGGGPAVFAGSGGTMPVAELAARLHERICRQPASALTSLGLVEAPTLIRRGALLISSSAKHPDAQLVLADLATGRFRPAALLTHRDASGLVGKVAPDCEVIQVPQPAKRDGFLATNSVLQLAVLLLRAYENDPGLPSMLPETRDGGDLRREVLLLSGLDVWPAACDLEIRLSEAGLASVQLVDYRNFAHGRHTGYERKLDETTVIGLSGPGSASLAEATLDRLPAQAHIEHWSAKGSYAGALLELLVRSMRFVGNVGASRGIDVARPKVPQFGRRLYRLALRSRVEGIRDGPVDRKLLALGAHSAQDGLRREYEASAQQWREEIEVQRFKGFVLDYDGTICWTARRYELPQFEVRECLQTLLDKGLFMGVASGRGKSLHRHLRAWLPEILWPQVCLGLYNGAIHLSLDQELPDLRGSSDWTESVTAAIGRLPFADRLRMEARSVQVKLEAKNGFFIPAERLAELVRERLAEDFVDAKVVASGHSLDVIGADVTKRSVVDAIQKLSGAATLSIGDQGQLGGNDFDLLGCQPWSLTVDRCSADPTRCWYAGDGKKVGPALLVDYLGALREGPSGFQFTAAAVP